jgi:hypothetical protein
MGAKKICRGVLGGSHELDCRRTQWYLCVSRVVELEQRAAWFVVDAG